MTVVVLSYFMGWNFDFLGLLEMVRNNCFFVSLCSNCGNDTFCIANS